MVLAHGGHEGPVSATAHLPWLFVVLVGAGYVAASLRARRRQGWPRRRTASFVAGVLVLATGLSPAVAESAEGTFSAHALQHLLVAMVAPLLLVLGTPVTLALRTLPHAAARRLGRALDSAPARVLSAPVTALVLSSGGLVVLYFTPLYELSTRSAGVHALVHVHLVASGFLFAWVIAGLEPGARRSSLRTRLVTLGVAIAVHAGVAQLLHAGIWVRVDEPVEQLRAAGSLMYFGGDVVELLLALVMLVNARPAPTRPVPARGPALPGAPGRTDLRLEA